MLERSSGVLRMFGCWLPLCAHGEMGEGFLFHHHSSNSSFSLASGTILTLGSFDSWEKESLGAPDFQGKSECRGLRFGDQSWCVTGFSSVWRHMVSHGGDMRTTFVVFSFPAAFASPVKCFPKLWTSFPPHAVKTKVVAIILQGET